MATEQAMVVSEAKRPLTAVQVRAQVNLIQEVMKAVMQKDVHYGVIPGCQKPSLYKPGSEKLLSTFNIAIEPVVTDLSTSDEVRFRVETRATNYITGEYLGSGIGECSSSEEKYKWRKAVCDEEFDETPDDRKREKWALNYQTKKPYKIKQVRTNIADVANTVLKMAKKRSQIDVTLTVTAASDIFTQDIEDLPPEARDIASEGPGPDLTPKRASETNGAPASVTTAAPASQPATEQAGGASAAQGAAVAPEDKTIVTEKQLGRLYAIAHSNKITKEIVDLYLQQTFGIDSAKKLKRGADYEQACKWAETAK